MDPHGPWAGGSHTDLILEPPHTISQHNAEHFYFVHHLSGARADCGLEGGGAEGLSSGTQLCGTTKDVVSI